jgi:glycine dehydrogenase
MVALTWPELNIHPFAPKDQAQGYTHVIDSLRNWLKSVTKFDEISFQPNSGATG